MAHNARSSALRSVAVAVLTCAVLAEAAFEKGHVHLPFNRVGKRPSLSNRDAHDSPAAVSIGHKLLAYSVNVQVGTPPQDMSLSITTSSGLSWLQSAASSDCKPSQRYLYPDDDPYGSPTMIDVPSLCQFGSFNKSISSTYMAANQQFDSFSAYGFGGFSVYGKNMTDTLVVGDLEFPDMPLGLVTTGTPTYAGVLGLGYRGDDYSDGYGDYPLFMNRIVKNGHAVTRAFSLWLDDAEGTSGSLLFGAIDQARYEGDLMRITAQNAYASYGTFGMEVVGLETASDAESTFEPLETHDFPLGVTIDPGELFSQLPAAVFNKIADLTGASYNSSTGFTTIPCDAASTNAARFKFRLAGPDGPVVNFETADLIIPSDLMSSYYSYYSRSWPEGVCFFGIQNADEISSYGIYSFGNSLLRRTYLVFDLENQELAAAPVKFKSAGENEPSPTIVAFASSGAPVPSASLYCADYSCHYECTEEYCPTSIPPPTFPTSTSGSDPREAYWRSVALGVGLSFGATALVAGIAITIIWGRVCRGVAYPAKKFDDEDGADFVPTTGPVMSNAGTTGVKMQSSPVVLPPGTLPVIREEDSSSRAPQLPVVAKASPITPPEPLTPSNRNSIAVSAVSSEDGPVPESASASEPATTGSGVEAPKSPKGKEADRTENA
ncbi:aspartic proteinase yapsin-3 [Naviculisporaceae sp. PSN 640]